MGTRFWQTPPRREFLSEVGDRAIGELRDEVESGTGPGRASVLVDVLLYEGRVEDAWTAAVQYNSMKARG